MTKKCRNKKRNKKEMMVKIETRVKEESTGLPSWIEDEAMVEEVREAKQRRKMRRLLFFNQKYREKGQKI